MCVSLKDIAKKVKQKAHYAYPCSNTKRKSQDVTGNVP
jgi:hypothetical protein